jgi:3-deoxy-D-manno-octulosonate 8-phosphate phosphatase (KDO 8-P phosphatase)
MTAHDVALAQARRLRLMAFDVDGVLSDGSLYYTDEGIEIKAFNTLDGFGLKMLQNAGIVVAIITGRRARCVELRAQNLGIRHLFQAVDNKRETLDRLLAELGIGFEESGYMGDDIVDVQRHASLTTTRHGGRGAAREVCEFILEAQGKLEAAFAPYLPTRLPTQL